jgi:hypothetical protein
LRSTCGARFRASGYSKTTLLALELWAVSQSKREQPDEHDDKRERDGRSGHDWVPPQSCSLHASDE